MFNRKALAVIALFCCFFESIGKNMDDQTIGEKLGKPVHTFIETLNGAKVEQFCHTTELSRILLVGEPRFFEYVRHLPIINVISLLGPLFDNRFKNFIKNVEKSSQRQLQEAIEDAIALRLYNTKAYSVGKLLNYLVEALQNKIAYIRDKNSLSPNAYNQYLDKYEELLAFVQKLKEELETNGSITLELANGRTATFKDDDGWVIFN